MGFWTYARQRLVPLLAALLGTALLCFLLSDIAVAEDAAPPVCGGKILEKCTPNSGDTAWMLTSVALVLMMTIPGLGSYVSQGHPERHRQGRYRQSQPTGRDHPGKRVYLLPDDVRHHYAGADCWRVRRAHEILGHALVHRAVGDFRLCADCALGLGTCRVPGCR